MLAYYGGKKSITRFIRGLNLYLHSLGLNDTRFYNAHGLTYPHHVSTAYDLALLGTYVVKNTTLLEICKQKQLVRALSKSHSVIRPSTNRNILEGKLYCKDVIGLKTGYTAAAGYTYVAAATRNGRTLVAAFLGGKKSTDRFCDAYELFELAFDQEPEKIKILEKGVTIKHANKEYSTTSDIYDYVYPTVTIKSLQPDQAPLKGAELGNRRHLKNVPAHLEKKLYYTGDTILTRGRSYAYAVETRFITSPSAAKENTHKQTDGIIQSLKIYFNGMYVGETLLHLIQQDGPQVNVLRRIYWLAAVIASACLIYWRYLNAKRK